MNISINNHRYDPAIDTLVAESKKGGECFHNFEFCDEKLYVNKGGYYYLERRAGVDKAYASWGGGTKGYGWRIIPLTEAEAENWKKAHKA